MIPLLRKTLEVVATRTVTPIAGLIESEAVTVQFKTFSFFTIAINFLVRVDLLHMRTSFSSFFDSNLLLFNLQTTIWFLTLISNFLLTVRHLLFKRKPHTLLALFLILIL